MYNKNLEFGLITLSGFLVLDLGINELTYYIDSGSEILEWVFSYRSEIVSMMQIRNETQYSKFED
jgi:hypothetical protein